MLFLSHHFLGDRALGCISVSPSLKRSDYQFAIDFCADKSIELRVVETQELLDEDYFSNPNNRCYFCKSHLYKTLALVQREYPTYTVLNGTNTDDLGDYRPGLQAANEHAILSPLVDCAIDKETVRKLALHFDLPNWQKPASPCLSSRVPYGQVITLDKLKQIEHAEQFLSTYQFSDVRVRHYGEEARIEVPHFEIDRLTTLLPIISEHFASLGFSSTRIDQEGLVSGKLNRAILS